MQPRSIRSIIARSKIALMGGGLAPFFLTLTLFDRFPAMIVDYQWESNFEWAILGDPRLNFVNLRHVYPPQA